MSVYEERRLLFVHSNGPTHVHRRAKNTSTNIRRHVMKDIGKSRRKSPRNPQLPVELRGVVSHENFHSDRPLPPFWSQDPLTVLEQQWPMDMFSAYGISLLAAEGKRLLSNTHALSGEGFSFPFAFTSSAFLRHYSAVFSDPHTLRAINYPTSARIHVKALERSLETISCIEATLTDTNFDLATLDRVISAVLSVICYNLLERELNQARIHINGLSLLINARGGIQSLGGNNKLRLMIFWIDVTASLLFNTRPRYSIPSNLILPTLRLEPSIEFLPIPLSRIFAAAEAATELKLIHILACVTRLGEIAADIESELANKGVTLWKDEIFLGMRLNPLAHRLFDRALQINSSSSPIDQVFASIRLGVIVWIIWVKRMCQSWPGSPMAYVPELLNLLNMRYSCISGTTSDISDDILSIRLWLSLICGLASFPGSTQRKTAVKLIASDARRLDKTGWAEIMVRVRSMPWISSFETQLAEVRGDVQQLNIL